ncbi:MAG: nucleotidyltransferase domain-containing protein [Deltaproteobacteria bacterium]|nr:nucleotidyltransferase domain-containing protein [Deltaproteobacteria bacterium]
MKTVSPELLAEITRRLVAEFQPEQIILFDSHAWGTPNEDSDVDLCVILSRSDEKPIKRAVRAQHCMDRLLVPTDIMVKTRTEIDRYRHVPASLERKILQQGKILYGRGQTGTRTDLACATFDAVSEYMSVSWREARAR